MKSIFKNVLTNWKTTFVGVLLLVTTLLTSYGVIDAEQGADLTKYSNGIVNSIIELVGFVSSIVLIFKAKDSSEKIEQ